MSDTISSEDNQDPVAEKAPGLLWFALVLAIAALFIYNRCSSSDEAGETPNPASASQDATAREPPSPSSSEYILIPGEWSPYVDPRGKKCEVHWETPDRKLRVHFRFKNGRITEKEFEYGKPESMGTDPCDFQFFHKQGGSVRVTLQ